MSETTIPGAGITVPSDAPAESCPMPTSAQAPGDELLVEALAAAKTIAVVGASPHEERTSHQIAVWLIENTPLEVFLVNPAGGEAEILGHAFYDSIADLPTPPDIVDVFRRAEYVDPIADDAVAADAHMLWLQLGVVNDAAIERAREAGLVGVQNRCIKIEWARLAAQIDTVRTERED
ncbi:CoA-binding protein [Demequina aurantiaca]|uniref:CoA-binding protein n=1 Tax=Demequina aurantiaca TaxID=676200 RepID=UPI000A008263|nr:CoA-binding protein [Demequina aurantiaca]